MAGLNNTISDTQQTSTTLPDWYNAAQTGINTAGANAAQTAPALADTTAGNAINTLNSTTNNPFTQASGALNTIASGAANPWITDASGNVTPNTNTAMGGLFQAQNQQLNQLLPTTTAPDQANAIGSGGFGSLRGQTAVDTAKANALSTMRAQQLQAALTNQQTGTTAAADLGNVGQQGINANMNVGQAQMNAPFTNATNYANLIGSMQVPTTTTSQVQTSPLTQAATIANMLQGSGAAGGLGSLLFGTAAVGTPGTSGYKPATGLGGIGNLLQGAGSSLWKSLTGVGGSTGTQAGTYPLEGGGSVILNADGSETIVGPDGTRQYYDASGNPTTVAQDLQNQNIIPDSSATTQSTGGSDTTALDQLINDTQVPQ